MITGKAFGLGGWLIINAKALKMDMAGNYSAGIIFALTVCLYT